MTAKAQRNQIQRRARAKAGTKALPDGRRKAVIDAAARLFGAKGFEGTSMRDIAGATGILAGSLYHHFRSKDALFVAVYAQGVEHIERAAAGAVAGERDPWRRLEVAAVAHLETLLTENSPTAAVISSFAIPNLPMRKDLVRLRDSYERIFGELVAALPLPRGVDRRVLRLSLLGAMNWALGWYRPGGDTPAAIARKIVALFRPQ